MVGRDIILGAFQQEVARTLRTVGTGPPPDLSVADVALLLDDLQEKFPRETLELRLCAALRKYPIEVTERVLFLVQAELVTWAEPKVEVADESKGGRQ